MKQGKSQNIFELDVHSANPASPVLPFAYFTAWEGAKPGHCAALEGQIEACRLLHLPGTKTRSNFLLTPSSVKKLVTLSLLRQKAPAILTFTGAALGVTDMKERPCIPSLSFPPPKYNSFIQKEAMMEKSMSGLSISPHLLINLNHYLLICLDTVFLTHHCKLSGNHLIFKIY